MIAETLLQQETGRLYEKLKHVGFDRRRCELFAPLTSEINRLKREKRAVILAHTYQTPDILYGIADYYGDSFQLSKKAKEVDAETIIFCGVRFMAESAKILNPDKTVLLPSVRAGCTLADAITAEDVRKLRKQHPKVPIVAYINTTAEVKAEVDVCCTSANVLQIIEALPGDEVIFVPDEFMAKNVQKMTKKKIIPWKGHCIVHQHFDPKKIAQFRQKYPGLKVAAHTECSSELLQEADFAGGTGDMLRYIQATEASSYMLVTECSFSDHMRVQFPEKNFLGMCALCPFMKQNTLPLVLQTLKNPMPGQYIEIPEPIRRKAEHSLTRMFELTKH